MNVYPTRASLVVPLAIARVLYERDVLAGGYTEAALQTLHVWVKDEVHRMARSGSKIAGVTANKTQDGWYIESRVDWYALAANVERALPSWRRTITRVDGPVLVRS